MNLSNTNIATDIPMFKQPQLTFRPFFHSNLYKKCQGHIKAVNFDRFIQKHEDIKSLQGSVNQPGSYRITLK